MRTSYQITSIVLLAMLTHTSIAEQATFGRFFTSPKQRQQLDVLRAAKPDVEDEIILVDDLPDETLAEEEDEIILDALTVRGVVYRKNRKNTAWLNNSNTNQGDLSFGPVRVDERGIKNDRVDIELTDNDTSLTLKVGETYDPHSSAISDLDDKEKGLRGSPRANNDTVEQQ